MPALSITFSGKSQAHLPAVLTFGKHFSWPSIRCWNNSSHSTALTHAFVRPLTVESGVSKELTKREIPGCLLDGRKPISMIRSGAIPDQGCNHEVTGRIAHRGQLGKTTFDALAAACVIGRSMTSFVAGGVESGTATGTLDQTLRLGDGKGTFEEGVKFVFLSRRS